MSNVNSDVQSVVQNTNYIYKATLDLWAMPPIELKMYITAMFIVSILMQYIKKSFLTQCGKKERIQKLWSISFPIAIGISMIGVYLYGNKIHIGYFVLTGLTVSTVSMGVHRLAVDYVWPFLKSLIGAVLERVMLFVRGAPKE